ncbi:hypothetical protein Dthio_PD3605 [Desulfonatronospira thiodismutans ASO3-1]|uniref:Prepilin-type N-terminal cleavage/methylation domain-containing protein n=1 Tax=Desulfonatronospira thiodismutans ASO3-1 TaxID=555779 RepID=D6SJU8_9BACT|nr:prepilin-type N-terminal cleavage/methylation domain-containing protein [Desulfonatronospira thiodismutans]EFI36151.1 hypothetical protein Dthio_PD3605 [Desulfonatronospira thiodismutans ASO3-1]
MYIQNKQTGLTLVELLIALAILGVVMTAVVSLFISTIKVYHTNKAILEVQQNVRHVRTVLNNDLKMVGFELDESEIQADNHEFKIGDITYTTQEHTNGDGSQEYDFVRKRNEASNGVTSILMPNLSSKLNFTYYDKDRNEIEPNSNENGDSGNIDNPSEIRKVQFTLCGKAWGRTPFISDQFEHCAEDTIIFRNMYYQ